MDMVVEAAVVLGFACIAVASMLGITMSRLVQSKTGRTYWPLATNGRLASDYKKHIGADRNYVIY